MTAGGEARRLAAEHDPLSRVRVHPHGERRFRGFGLHGHGRRAFGGSLLGQSARAAAHFADPSRSLHAVHAQFVSPATHSEPIDYDILPVKLGRSFDQCEVAASQDGRVVLRLQASFHHSEPSEDLRPEAPAVLRPESLTSELGSPPNRNPLIRSVFERRVVPPDSFSEPEAGGASCFVWIRARGARGAGQNEHAALLLYASDFLISGRAHALLDERGVSTTGASLDHAMWFHRRFRVDDWLLVQSDLLSYSGSRATTQCRVFDGGGGLVATAVQELLLRPVQR